MAKAKKTPAKKTAAKAAAPLPNPNTETGAAALAEDAGKAADKGAEEAAEADTALEEATGAVEKAQADQLTAEENAALKRHAQSLLAMEQADALRQQNLVNLAKEQGGLTKVIGLKHHECSIKQAGKKQRIKIVKGETQFITAFVYKVLTNPVLPAPIVGYVPPEPDLG